METEAKYYDGKPIETERERDLQCVNKSLVRQNNELRAEISGINKAYEVLEEEARCSEEQAKNLTEANKALFKLLAELTITLDKISEQNRDLYETRSSENYWMKR